MTWKTRLLKALPYALVSKTFRSILPTAIFMEGYEIRKPEIDMEKLYEEAQENHVLNTIFRVRVQEAIGTGWIIQPRFHRKCPQCGIEFKQEQPKCPECNIATIPPDQHQRRRFQKLLSSPHPNRNFIEILKSIFWWDLALGNFYISIEYRLTDNKLIPHFIHVEDARYIKVMADEKGKIGSLQYFCPICYKPDEYREISQRDKQRGKIPRCRKCKIDMWETAYVQEISGEIKARFAIHEIIHGSTTRVLPSLYGLSRQKCIWDIIHIIANMDELNEEIWRTGQLGQILNFPGYTAEELTALKEKLKQERTASTEITRKTGLARPSKRIRTIILSSREPIQRFDVMQDFKKLQSIDFYQLYREVAFSVYGVTATSAGVTGAAGRARTASAPIQLEVQDRVTRNLQTYIEDLFQTTLLPRFGITDWILKFNPIEMRDKLRAAQIEQIKANTAATYARIPGFTVSIDPQGNVTVTGQSTGIAGRPVGATKPKPKESGATGRLIEGTTTERQPFGPKPPTQET